MTLPRGSASVMSRATHLALVTPPVCKPAEPSLSGAAAAQVLRRQGLRVTRYDASIAWYRHTLGAASLGAALAAARGRPAGELLAYRRALRAVTALPPTLARAETYRDRHRYSSAVTQLDTALRLASVPWPGFRLRVAAVDHESCRVESAAAVAQVARQPTPFDRYYQEELIPALAAAGTTHVGVSLTFQDQVFGTFRLARLLRDALPGVELLLGGPLVACWAAAGAPLHGEAFGLFHRLVPDGSGTSLAALARELGGQPGGDFPGPLTGALNGRPGGDLAGPLTVDLDETPFAHYLAPTPRIPGTLGRGCYWRRCTFCPDHLHPRHEACGGDALEQWLTAVARRFPDGAMVHLTDSALTPAGAERVAAIIAGQRLPLRWHGFVRPEPTFADAAFARHLAAGGCVMLQLGVESAVPHLLELMGKGTDPAVVRRLLRATAAAGIRNQVYLLFGLPTETDDDREETLALVNDEAGTIADINHALLNLPRQSPMHRDPARFGITVVSPFGPDTDLSLYDDFRCGSSHPRLEARRWLQRRFLKSPSVRAILGGLRAPFKANHACYL